MNDQFLYELRQTPRPEFADALRERLQRLDAARPASANRTFFRLLATAATVLVMAGSLAFPAVRSAARQFLDLFRDRTVAEVRFDPARVGELRREFGGRSPALLMFEETRIVAQSAREASFTADTIVPPGIDRVRVETASSGRARFTVDREKLHSTFDRLDLQEIRVPREMAEASFELVVPPGRIVHFSSARLIVREDPHAVVPGGVGLPLFGEIGLRVAGVEAAEAARLARSIDWASSLLVPFPQFPSAFKEVTINGEVALLVSGDGGERSLTWKRAGRLYSLIGVMEADDMIGLARAVR